MFHLETKTIFHHEVDHGHEFLKLRIVIDFSTLFLNIKVPLACILQTELDAILQGRNPILLDSMQEIRGSLGLELQELFHSDGLIQVNVVE